MVLFQSIFRSYLSIGYLAVISLVLACHREAPREPLDGAGQTAEPSGTLGLVAHWPLDEGRGDKVHDIASGTEFDLYHGKSSGVKWHPSGGVEFDGVDDHIDVGAVKIGPRALSLSARFRQSRSSGCKTNDCRIISQASGIMVQEQGFILGLKRKDEPGAWLQFRLRINGKTENLVAKTKDAKNGEEVHVAAVYDGTFMRLFKNGNMVAEEKKPGRISLLEGASCWIGGNPPDSKARPWDGVIEDVRVYKRALSAAEVKKLANLGDQNEEEISIRKPGCTAAKFNGHVVNLNGETYRESYESPTGHDKICLTSIGTPVVPVYFDPKRKFPENVTGKTPWNWTPEESHLYWEYVFHHSLESGAVKLLGGPRPKFHKAIVEFAHINRTGDGIQWRQKFNMPADAEEDQRFYTVRDVYIQRAGDDAIENDWLTSGLIQHVLIDGASMALSPRASSSSEHKLHGASANTWAVEDSVIRLVPQYATHKGRGRRDEMGQPLPAHGGFFKWDGDPDLNVGLELRNNVFVAYHQPSSGSMLLDLGDVRGSPKVNAAKSHDNVVVWLGRSAYPPEGHTLPPWASCTRDIAIFRKARAKWFAQHPQFQDPFQNGGTDPAETFWKTYRSAPVQKGGRDLSYKDVAAKPCSEPLW